MSIRKVFIIFCADMVPSDEEKAIADSLPGDVRWRNVNYIGDNEKAEPCDGVACAEGVEIPKPYARLPRWNPEDEALDIPQDAGEPEDEEVEDPGPEKAPGTPVWKPNL